MQKEKKGPEKIKNKTQDRRFLNVSENKFTNSNPGHLYKRNGHLHSQHDLYKCSQQLYSQYIQMGKIQIYINRKMDKENVINLYSGLYSAIKMNKLLTNITQLNLIQLC